MPTPNQAELDKGTPFILLAGQKWAIMRLVLEQTRYVVPALVRLGNTQLTLETTEQVDDLMTAIYHSLLRANQITRAEFNQLEITTFELIGAIDVIAKQCGWVKPVTPGENQGSLATDSQLGNNSVIGSSAISANHSDGHRTTAKAN